MLSFGSAIMVRSLSQGSGDGAQCGGHVGGRSGILPLRCSTCSDRGDIHRELTKTDPGYYFRPHKTILVAHGCRWRREFLFCGDHRATLPLTTAVMQNQ